MLQEPFEWSVRVGDSINLTDVELAEFTHHIFEAATREYGANGHAMSSSGTALEVSETRYRLSAPTIDVPDLLILREHDVTSFVALGTGSQLASLWESPLAEACERLGRAHESYEWTAIIGVLHDDFNQGPALAEELEIGGMRLASLSAPFFEFAAVPTAPYNLLSTGNARYSWPVGVGGSADGYTWQGSADRSAADSLHALCTLLTLISNIPWGVRRAAQPGLNLDVTTPSFNIGPGPAADLFSSEELTKTDLEIPSDTDGAWRRMSADRRLAEAAGMFSEGVELSKAHPSFALIAFVSAIESTAQINKGAARCEACNQVKGSTQRFHSAIAGVLDDNEATLLASAYAQRSGTAHRSKLYGAEQTRGSFLFPKTFGADETVTFQWTTLRLARRAARRLILGPLGLSDLPA